ncbi:MAG: dihydroneopterin aldolase [Verrucomicrobiota bacterium]
MSKINIVDLELFCRVGVSEEERAQPQRLLVSLDMDYDFSSAAISDRINRTIDYIEVTQRLQKMGERRNWKIIETLATDIANKILKEFHPDRVTVELKKFPSCGARYVSVTVTMEPIVTEDFKRPWWWGGWR